MKIWIVTKSPVDLPDTFEFVGAFSSREAARAACLGAGQFKIACVELNRVYRGDLRDVVMLVHLDHRQL